MLNITKILIDGGILSLLVSIWLMFTLRVNARIFLHDYPPAIQEKVLPKTVAEKRITYIFGVPFMLLLILGSFFSTMTLKALEDTQFWALWLNAAGIMFVFNVVDWLVLDWLIFCTITPRFVVIPGSEGMAAYKDYSFHFRGFLHGLAYLVFGGLIIATIVFFL
jgi:hypothetical protein